MAPIAEIALNLSYTETKVWARVYAPVRTASPGPGARPEGHVVLPLRIRSLPDEAPRSRRRIWWKSILPGSE